MSNNNLLGDYRRPVGYAACADAIPFLLDDTYHLFNLASPPDTIYHPPRLESTWIRQRSQDLVNWARDPRPAMTPGHSDAAPDKSGAWTGSVVIGPDDTMHLFYTGLNLLQGGKQVILHAKSTDRTGTHFKKPLNPIPLDNVPTSHIFESTDFRDPYVFWNSAEGRYWMIVATRLSKGPYWTRGCFARLTSDDLEVWTLHQTPIYSPNNIFCPECPELFTLGNGKWYLVYSRFASPNGGTVYVMADSPYGPFRAPRDGSGGRFDGRRWYAAKSCPKRGDPTKRISFAWVADRYDRDDKWLWGGSLLSPREISANPDGSLVMQSVPEVTKVFQPIQPVPLPSTLSLDAVASSTAVALPFDRPATGVSHCLTMTLAATDAKSFGLLFEYDHDWRGYRISFEQVTNEIYSVALVTDLPAIDDFWAQLTNHEEIPKLIDGAELVKHGAVKLDGPLRLVMSEDIIEFFVDGKVITFRLRLRAKANIMNGDAKENGTQSQVVHPVGLFVEDGTIEFSNLVLSSMTGA
jgi:beta-fructofuranosidase